MDKSFNPTRYDGCNNLSKGLKLIYISKMDMWQCKQPRYSSLSTKGGKLDAAHLLHLLLYDMLTEQLLYSSFIVDIIAAAEAPFTNMV